MITIWYTVLGMTQPAPEARVLDRTGNVPLYLQVAQLLRQEIMSGRWVTGDMLPGEAPMQAAWGCSQSVIRAAMSVLRQEGLVETRRGAGSFVRHIPPRLTVAAGPGDIVTCRMPTPAERAALGVAEGVPVLVVERPGRAEELFDASRAILHIGP